MVNTVPDRGFVSQYELALFCTSVSDDVVVLTHTRTPCIPLQPTGIAPPQTRGRNVLHTRTTRAR